MKKKEEEEVEIKETIRRVRKLQYLEVKDGRLWLHAKTAKLEKTSDVTWTLKIHENFQKVYLISTITTQLHVLSKEKARKLLYCIDFIFYELL